MDATVHDAPGRSRYELVLDGNVIGVLDYRIRDDAVVLPHTEISLPLRGQGYGAQLVAAALDDLRSQGKRVVPVCWYVREFIGDNEEYRDLVA